MDSDSSLRERAQALYEGELLFLLWEEGATFLSRRFPAADVLVLLDASSVAQYAFFKERFPAATVFVTGNEGAEKLFALSDDISLVLSCGEDALVYARYFATLRALPCAHFLTRARARTLCLPRVRLLVGGEKTEYPVKFPEYVFIDGERMSEESAVDAYIGAMSAPVALLEEKFDGILFARRYKKEERETLLQAYSSVSGEPFASLSRNALFAAAYLCDKVGHKSAFQSEVGFLSDVYRTLGLGVAGGLYAVQKLSRLYRVFFSCGTYRRYYTPPYLLRTQRAAGLYKRSEEEISSRLSCPSVERLSVYADVFETVRAQFSFEAEELLRRAQWLEENVPKGYKKETDNRLLNAALQYLPEGRKAYGITSLMRDFGLMDF